MYDLVRFRNPIRYATHIIVRSSMTWVYVLRTECMAPKWGVDRAQMQPPLAPGFDSVLLFAEFRGICCHWKYVVRVYW